MKRRHQSLESANCPGAPRRVAVRALSRDIGAAGARLALLPLVPRKIRGLRETIPCRFYRAWAAARFFADRPAEMNHRPLTFDPRALSINEFQGGSR